jgi:hypothetical protein
VDHLGEADELEGHEHDRVVDVERLDRVLVALDGDEREVLDRADRLERRADRLRLREIERETARRRTDLLGDGRRPRALPAGETVSRPVAA